jgi:cytoplasmic iron level regulating protein YaaA (DUF328/UPF0246 family)
VLILLPPSEGKAAPVRGRPVDLARLSFPGLTADRERLLDPGLRRAPALPAYRIYTGVLYGELDLATIPPAVRRRFVIISAQFGAVRPGDRIPTYRRTMDAAYWRPRLASDLQRAAGRGVILDCRSAVYAAAWRPEGAQAERWAHVSVVRERGSVRSVVSHDAKRTRGAVARHVALAKERPGDVESLAALVGSAFRCELTEPERDGSAWRLVIVT